MIHKKDKPNNDREIMSPLENKLNKLGRNGR